MKLKTHKGTAKRFKLSKKGKIKHSGAGKSHLLTGKSRKRKRMLRKARSLQTKGQKQQIRRLLPYG
ncbi:MAG: 50S ribosomal protein L35 [Candidatus Omnitrophica bacterium]|nr:50S ribosomal protein L35 [Candidatus Omnitrophota bacterium]